MTDTGKTNVKVIFGAMTFGKEGAPQSRVHDLSDCGAILDVFRNHGHVELDTSRVYGEGSSEEFLGELNWQKRGIVMETKYYPTVMMKVNNAAEPEGGWRHTEEHMRENLGRSLKALKTDSVDMWYLHGPDRTTPYEETMKVVNELYKEGKFRRFGVSNFMAWEVAQIQEICIKNNWVRPTVYQGVYNALHRLIESELLSCLRKYDMSFYAFNPLAGGYLTSRYHRDDSEYEAGSRYDPEKTQGQMYRARYWKDEYFDALDILRPVAAKHGFTEAECALRWMTHHSMLERKQGDGIIIGASSVKHIEENMIDLEKGALPEDVVKALDEGWAKVKGIAGRYHH